MDISTKKRVKVFKKLLTNDEAASHLVRIVEVHDLRHVVVGRNEAFYERMIRSHPELLQQVDVVLLLLDQLPYRLHSQRLVLGPEGCRHAPGVQGHQLEADDGSKTSRGREEVGEDEGSGKAKAPQKEEAEAADGCSTGGPSGGSP